MNKKTKRPAMGRAQDTAIAGAPQPPVQQPPGPQVPAGELSSIAEEPVRDFEDQPPDLALLRCAQILAMQGMRTEPSERGESGKRQKRATGAKS